MGGGRGGGEPAGRLSAASSAIGFADLGIGEKDDVDCVVRKELGPDETFRPNGSFTTASAGYGYFGAGSRRLCWTRNVSLAPGLVAAGN
jgi:hypothetical protein